MDNLLTTKDLATILGTTPAAIRRRLERNSQSLPPAVRITGSRLLYWRQAVVEAWLAALPTRVARKPQPRRYKEKAPVLTGEAAIWEKYKGQ